MPNRIRILLVDDNPGFLEAASLYLELQPALVVVGAAANGAAAQSCLTAAPDVILLDVNLGAESGLDLIPEFKRRLPAVKIIVVTLLAPEHYRVAALAAHADRFVVKAQITETLLPAIWEVLGQPAEASPAGSPPAN